jgi:hypothetical protein
VIPNFPRGASIESILIAVHRVNKSSGQKPVYTAARGSRQLTHLDTVFGWGARYIAETLLDGKISAESLITDYSAWPVYACLLPRSRAQIWFDRNLNSSGARGNSYPEVFVRKAGPFSAVRWRFCSECAAEQRDRYGTPHWMVLHQLPGVQHCPLHDNRPLEIECADCSSALGGALQCSLPCEPCEHCGSGNTRRATGHVSSGQRLLTQLYMDLLCGIPHDLDPISRSHLLHQTQLSLSDGDPDRLNAEMVLKSFACKTYEDLQRTLGVAVSPRLLQVVLDGGSVNVAHAALHLAISAIALHELSLREAARPGEIWNKTDSWSRYLESSGVRVDVERFREIAESAAELNINPEAIIKLMRGFSQQEVVSQGLAPELGLEAWLSKLSSPHGDTPRRIAQRLIAWIGPPRSSLEDFGGIWAIRADEFRRMTIVLTALNAGSEPDPKSLVAVPCHASSARGQLQHCDQ